MPRQWARSHESGYEVSSKGDSRFSALYARLKDGRTIEEAYQLDVKGYRQLTNNWRVGKGKPPINGKTADDLHWEYTDLWRQWAKENPRRIEDLRRLSTNKVLTDCFATGPVNQARSLAIVLDETEEEEL